MNKAPRNYREENLAYRDGKLAGEPVFEKPKTKKKKGRVYVYEGPCRGVIGCNKKVSIRCVDTEGKFPLIFLTCPFCGGTWCYLKTG